MDTQTKIGLIKRNLQEIIGEEELKRSINKKNFSVYWGTMPTGSPHISYFLPLLKIKDFLKAELKVKILIADLHAALDGVSWEVLEKRQTYYEKLFPEMLRALDVNPKNLEFVKGSKIQLSPKYFEDVLKMSMLAKVKEATKASSEVVKMGKNPKLGNLLYPILQALDEEYLKVDAQFGGMDQRKLFVFARENLPKLGYKRRIELINPIIPGLIGEKMSASIPGSKIDILDDKNTAERKIKKADCVTGNPNNGIMKFMKYVIFPIKEDKNKQLTIERPEKYGGNLSYKKYQDLEKDFISKKVHPLDVKNALSKEINNLLEPIRKNKTLQKLKQGAYRDQ